MSAGTGDDPEVVVVLSLPVRSATTISEVDCGDASQTGGDRRRTDSAPSNCCCLSNLGQGRLEDRCNMSFNEASRGRPAEFPGGGSKETDKALSLSRLELHTSRQHLADPSNFKAINGTAAESPVRSGRHCRAAGTPSRASLSRVSLGSTARHHMS
jgi:hypothetical protein